MTQQTCSHGIQHFLLKSDKSFVSFATKLCFYKRLGLTSPLLDPELDLLEIMHSPLSTFWLQLCKVEK